MTKYVLGGHLNQQQKLQGSGNTKRTDEVVDVQLKILWINLSCSGRQSTLAQTFRQYCQVHLLEEPGNTLVANQLQCHAICFEFDYPDVQGLNLLKRTASEYPDLPILMISHMHSEELAIWALRARVWEYLVTPVQSQEIEAVTTALAVSQSKNRRRRTHFEPSPNFTIPNDYRHLNASAQKSQLVPALNYVINHLHEKIKECDVAGLCHMTQFKFSRAFKRNYGVTFQEYLIAKRMEKASQLLCNPKVLVADVAAQVGFKDPAYFTRTFKRLKGKSPSDCRGAGADALIN